MSDNPHLPFGIDNRERIIRIEAGATRSELHRLPSIEETLNLLRISTNFLPGNQSSEPTNGKQTLKMIKTKKNL